MHAVFSLILGFGLLVLAVLGLVALAIVRAVRGKGPGAAPGLDEEEARLIQELHQGLERMEKRVESLETILLDRPGKD
ncbi:MAG: hypothetical protein KQJ78_12015 [Deltaproteobacteria bacterium]|nr:hypothetical protein [Deltaproteobacteria bacterium]